MSDPVERHSEVRVAAEEGVMATVTELDVIEATGADAANYLHGQLSQNVERLTDGETRWTLLLQPQGKIDAWMRIHRVDPERFLLVVDSGFGPTAQTRLDRFKLRVDAAFNTTTRPALALRGPGSAELARTLASGSPVTVVAADWGGPGCDLVAEPGAESVIGELLAVLPESAVRGSARSLEMVRVLRGQPAMGSELDGSTIPAAAGVVEESVDFTKGCYVGQELVARVDSRGSNTPTNLVRLLLSAQS
ncbi:MAG: hypothetical protein OER95_11365, partial [Acidimicrobiia bacterium]|nr:hypothetical protein [Acidimicrobiia bacterium]